MADCFICTKHQSAEASIGLVYEDDLVYVGHVLPHALDSVYLGYLMVEPKRHASGLGDLTATEAAAVGRAANSAAKALKASEGAEHVYSFVLGDGVPHLHLHVVPRYPGAPQEYWGVRVDEWPDAPRAGAADIAPVCDRLRRVVITDSAFGGRTRRTGYARESAEAPER